MKSILFFPALVLATSSMVMAAAVPRSTDQLTCKGNEIHDLKWITSGDDKKWGYLSFSNRKDAQGRPIATTLEKNGKPAKPVEFEWLRCAAPKGKPGYMGFGDGKLGGGGESVGHIRLKSDPKLCLAAASLKKESNLVLEPCSMEDTQVQLQQFFALPSPNHIIMGFVGHKKSEGANGLGGHLFINEKEEGKPFKLSYTQKKSTNSLYWAPWETTHPTPPN